VSKKPLFIVTVILTLTMGPFFAVADETAAESSLTTGPQPLIYTLLTYDQDTNRAIMIGGTTPSNSWKEWEEVWAFDPKAQSWELLGNLGSHCFDSIAYDSRAGKVIVFCGIRYNPEGHHPWFPIDVISETWAYDVATNTWENLDPGPIKPPKGLLGTGMAYDSESGVVILHSGWDVNSFRYSNDTWAYDYASNTWTNMQPAGAPMGRNFHAVTYDAGADRVLSIGGEVSPNYNSYIPTNDVFAYDYNENVWTQLDSGNAPVRGYVSAEYIPSIDRVILFGGATYDIDSDPGLLHPIPNGDTWEFDYSSNTWTLLHPKTSPSARIWQGMTATEKGLVLFGGAASKDAPNNETWLFNAKSGEWKQVQ